MNNWEVERNTMVYLENGGVNSNIFIYNYYKKK